MPRFETRKNGVEMCTIHATMHLTREEYELLKQMYKRYAGSRTLAEYQDRMFLTGSRIALLTAYNIGLYTNQYGNDHEISN